MVNRAPPTFGLPPRTPARRPALIPPKKLPPELEELQVRVREQVSDISSRLKLLEERVDTLRNHIDVIDKSLIEKHKSAISELRTAEGDIRSLRADIDKIKDLAERLIKRMEAFASKEEVKVLERYVELWQPLKFVTRSEVAALVQKALKERGLLKDEEA